METRRRSGERRCARRKSEPGCGADASDEGMNADELNRLCREHLRRNGRAVAERAKPVTQRAVFRARWLGRCGETRVVVGVVMHRGRGIVVVVVGRVPSAQRARQDEDDRQCRKRLRAKSQRTYHRNRPGRSTQGAGRLPVCKVVSQAVRQSGRQAVSGKTCRSPGGGPSRSARRDDASMRSSRRRA